MLKQSIVAHSEINLGQLLIFETATMATAASIKDYSTKVLEEGLTCYICYDLLRDPKGFRLSSCILSHVSSGVGWKEAYH